MSVLIGIDTGGTFTDAVAYDPARGVIAKAKALTTHANLAEGVGAAVTGVLAAGAVDPATIGMVSLSTTLATNAMVEGQGGRVGLVFIGFDAADAGRPALKAALGADPLIAIAGGHDSFGSELVPLDEASLAEAARRLAPGLTGFAVTARFATRDPSHEIRARDILRRETGLPVTCGHELAAKLDGPKRAVTALLNTRLVHLIAALIDATEGRLEALGIHAPLMVVRGDGALVAASVARTRPIETIFSGPAASAVGGAFLAGAPDAIISDIGGTTTDVVILRGGRPRIDPDGAVIAGFRTMVEAIAIRTTGLGGDSEVALVHDGLDSRLALGPRRVMPVSLLATHEPGLVSATLERQLRAERPGPLDGLFVVPLGSAPADLAGPDAAILARLDGRPRATDRLVESRRDLAALARLAARRLVLMAGLTPSDAAHVLGRHRAWDIEAARLAHELFARKRDARGRLFVADAVALAHLVLEALEQRSAEFVLDTVLAEDGFPGDGLARHPLATAAMARHRGLATLSLGLNVPLVGLGASAATYYPAIAARLGAEGIVPADADVANAVGAVVGLIEASATATVLEPVPGRFRVTGAGGGHDFTSAEAALAHAEAEARREAGARAIEAGAASIEIMVSRDVRTADTDGVTIFVEAVVTARARGRPRIAS